jgi:hypothetical protein
MTLLPKLKFSLLSTGLVVALFAQQPPMPGKWSGSHPEEMEIRREKIEALRVYRMTEFLNLTEEQAVTFFPRLNAFENNIRQKQQQQMSLIREIDNKIKDANFKTSEAEVKKYCRQLADTERELIKEKEKFVEELGTVLSPEQQLRYLIFEARFRERLIRSLHIIEEKEVKRR